MYKIPYIDYNEFQDKLNAQFGEGVIQLILGNDNSIQEFYLQWAEDTPQNVIAAAINMANANASDILNRTKIRVCDDLTTLVNKVVASKSPPVYSSQELSDVQAWMADQSLPVPFCIDYTSISRNCSRLDAAKFILNSQEEYQNFLNQVESTKIAGQSATINSVDYYSCKESATPYIEQLKNLL